VYLRALLLLYVFLTPLLHALSPFPIVAFNAFLLPAAAVGLLFHKRTGSQKVIESVQLTMLLLLSAYGCIAWFWYDAPILQDRFQAAGQWMFSIWVLWIFVAVWINVSDIKFISISKSCFYSALFLSISTLVEFFISNNSGLYFSDLMHFSVDEFPAANVFGEIYRRPRVFSAEAGFTSTCFEMFLPLSLLYLRRRSIVMQIMYASIVLLALIVLSSVATFLSLTFAFSVLMFIKFRSLKVRILIIGLFAIVIFILSLFADSDQIPIYKIIDILDWSKYSSLEGERQEAVAAIFTLFRENPLGIGWGTVLQEAKIPGSYIDQLIVGSGLLNLWGELLVATGVSGLLVLLYSVGSVLARLAKSRQIEASLCFVAILSLALHHIAIYELWFPMFWFCLALGQTVGKHLRT
jgi:hypothetical protein